MAEDPAEHGPIRYRMTTKTTPPPTAFLVQGTKASQSAVQPPSSPLTDSDSELEDNTDEDEHQ
eukprot:2346373-Lingulodinium_polyedra.AAC.1